MPIISVIIQTYNHASYIDDCISGILAQDFHGSMEIIIGDDSSTDGTKQICEKYAREYDNITLRIRDRKSNIKINGSPTGRFNLISCIEEASGKYIAMCEGDDYWIDSEKLSKQFKLMEDNPDCSLSFTGGYILENGKRRDFHKSTPKDVVPMNELLFHWQMPTASIMFRREMVSLPDWFQFVRAGDSAISLLAASQGRVMYLHERTCVYRILSTGATRNSPQNWRIASTISMLYLMNQTSNHQYHKDIMRAILYWNLVLHLRNLKRFPLLLTSIIQNYFKRIL